MSFERTDTNTTTHFLREARALQMICDLVATPNTAAGRDTVVWSVGCSTGDEPYGLSMLCREAAANVSILATDVNPDALDHAQRARYSPRNLRHVDDTRRERWFRRDGSHWTVVPEVRDRVKFRIHDVVNEAAPRHDVDVVICRNVMVHFSPTQVKAAVATMASSLRPGALLVLGGAEWLRGELRARDGSTLVPLEKAGLIVYQRVDHTVRLPPPPVQVQPRPEPPSLPATAKKIDLPGGALGVEVTTLRREGDDLLDRGNPIQARALYERALDRAPLLADLHLRVALTHLHAKEHEDARESLRRALFLTPQLWPAWLLMAELANEPDQERHCLDRARLALETEDLDDDPAIEMFARDRNVALEAVRRRLRSLP